jgi:bifunctional UDP-N-acetylglucosamine pyrophosphorylase / glucosamine-1-phosphate N-acetyltransferase
LIFRDIFMNVVVLAAGQGKRMKSDLPKVLHRLSDKPLLGHVLDTARSLTASKIVVIYGHGGQIVPETMAAADLLWAKQDPPRGTGHAVQQGVDLLDPTQPTLILYGDVPLTKASTLQALLKSAGKTKLAILTVKLDDPTGYGRIVRNAEGLITGIVEQKDANAQERLINEINTGIMVVPTTRLSSWLSKLSSDNAQGEYYLTDIVGFAAQDGVEITHAHPDEEWETLGVNSKVQLAQLERTHQLNQANALMEAGVMLADPARIDVRGILTCGRDVEIDVGCVFEGHVTIGDGAKVGPYCVIKNAVIGAGSELQAYSHIEQAEVGAKNKIGPFARLRPGTELGVDAHIGNFVELKNAKFGNGSKANHLAYIGDAVIGQRVNIGAGTITCNYDGANKYQTVIEDDAFIGSDSQLVAPVTVGAGATLGAGTTLTKDAPANSLTVSRVKQTTLNGWERPVKVKK